MGRAVRPLASLATAMPLASGVAVVRAIDSIGSADRAVERPNPVFVMTLAKRRGGESSGQERSSRPAAGPMGRRGVRGKGKTRKAAKRRETP